MKTENILVIIVISLILLYFIYKNKNEKLDSISKNPTLGVYYTNWCGYSKRFLNELDNGLKNKLESSVSVKLVDCEKNPDECKRLNVRGYPTVILHKNNEDILYNGNRSEDDLINFINNNDKLNNNDISNNNKSNNSQQNNNSTLGVYYTTWCGYSRHFLDDLKNGLLNEIQKNNVNVNLVDCDADSQQCKRLNIRGFPSVILHTPKGDIPYNGDRSSDDLLNFIRKNN